MLFNSLQLLHKRINIYNIDSLLLLFPALCVHIQTHNLHILWKNTSLRCKNISLPSQVCVPLHTCCSSRGSPFWCSFTQSSTRLSYTQWESKNYHQETDSPFPEKRLLFSPFHTPPLSLILILSEIRDFNCMACEMPFFFQQLCLWYIIY